MIVEAIMEEYCFIHDEQIKELIKLRKKHFRKLDQKAELMKRNNIFRLEFQGISKRLGKKFFSTGILSPEIAGEFYANNYEFVYDYPNAKIIETDIPVDAVYSSRAELALGFVKASDIPPEWIQKDRFFKNMYDLDIVFVHGENSKDINVINRCELEVLSRYIEEWMDFCHRWNINHEWQGELNSLHKFIKETPQIVCRSDDMLVAEKKLKASTIEPINKELRYRYLYLKLDAWTGLKDIKKIWPRIEKLQKVIFEYKAEEKANFGRDLCWFDLYKGKNLSYSKIAKVWVENFPDDIDLLVLKSFKREHLKEIKRELKGETSVLLDNKILLKEIIEGRLKEKFFGDFFEEKKFYITGEMRRRKFTSPFMDTIKQAIKRMEKYIRQIQPAEYLISLPLRD